jgi:hypothetical protein
MMIMRAAKLKTDLSGYPTSTTALIKTRRKSKGVLF